MQKKVVVEVQAKTAVDASQSAAQAAMLSLADHTHTLRVTGVVTRYVSSRADRGKLLWTLECTVQLLGRPNLVPMPGPL